MASTLSFSLHDFKDWTTPGVRELMGKLIQHPHPNRDFLGTRLAKWIDATDGGDELLWQYIIREITSEDISKYQLSGKLRCAPHEFGSDHGFLERRMTRSESLLDSASSTLEDWSRRKFDDLVPPNWFAKGFLRETSYGDTHSRGDHHHIDAGNVLMRAVEAACLVHARANTQWWRDHEAHLRQSAEGALRYIAILAYTEAPSPNLDGIRSVLLDKDMLEYRWLFELGKLIHAAFYLLDETTQDGVTARILDLHAEHYLRDSVPVPWIIEARRDLLASIPCYLRSPVADTFLREACQRYGQPEDEPHIETSGGTVVAPFSHEKFLLTSDEGVIRILDHYKGDDRDLWEHHQYIGGSREVAYQLSIATSKLPNRFLPLLSNYWSKLDDGYRESILTGVTNHLRYRFAHLSPNGSWDPLETPSGPELADKLLNELDMHPGFWRGNRVAAQALEACAYVVESQESADVIVFHLVGMLYATDPGQDRQSGMDLVSIAINSTRGNAAEAALILANRWAEAGRPLPEMLATTLCRFAKDEHPAVRVVLLRRLPVLQYWLPELGWRVFDLATVGGNAEIWTEAEQCLYYAYHQHFDLVAPHLDRMCEAGAFESWGRIAALAYLAGHIPVHEFFHHLIEVTEGSAWKGAIQVFACNAGADEHRDTCIGALLWMLEHTPTPSDAANQIHHHLFSLTPPIRRLPVGFVQLFFRARNQVEGERCGPLFSFLEWLSVIAPNSPDEVLEAMETMLAHEQSPSTDLWHSDDFSVLSSLFHEAEEREQSDSGQFLTRVIALQDALLKIGANGLDQWLKDAERP